MNQGNFMKVVDTLEKYQQRVVNTKSESGKEFILFKRQLYQMYEVQNRSIDEHDQFSSKLERQNLKWLYQANLDYVGEMQRVNQLDNLVQHGALKGSIFKQKALSADRLYGLGAFSATTLAYMNYGYLTMLMGSTLPMVGMVAASIYGARKFASQDTISQIDVIKEGEFKGLLRMKVNKTLFSSYTVAVNPIDTKSLAAVGDDDMGEDDCESNILHAAKFVDERTGKIESNGIFTVPADAYRDKTTMEWIYAIKSADSETDALYSQKMMDRHMDIASTGGITGLRKLTAESTGYANLGDENELNLQLKNNQNSADETLIAMSTEYGQDKLEQMKPSEFYRLYKDYSLGKN